MTPGPIHGYSLVCTSDPSSASSRTAGGPKVGLGHRTSFHWRSSRGPSSRRRLWLELLRVPATRQTPRPGTQRAIEAGPTRRRTEWVTSPSVLNRMTAILDCPSRPLPWPVVNFPRQAGVTPIRKGLAPPRALPEESGVSEKIYGEFFWKKFFESESALEARSRLLHPGWPSSTWVGSCWSFACAAGDPSCSRRSSFVRSAVVRKRPRCCNAAK